MMRMFVQFGVVIVGVAVCSIASAKSAECTGQNLKPYTERMQQVTDDAKDVARGAPKLCVLDRRRAAAQSKFNNALEKYLERATGDRPKYDEEALKKTAAGLIQQCVEMRRTTNHYHTVANVLVEAEDQAICTESVAPMLRVSTDFVEE